MAGTPMTRPMPDRERTIADTYRALLARLDRWFAEARERAGGAVPCRGGCAACCHGPFDISVADALLLRRTVDALPAPERAAVEAAAARQLARVAELEPNWHAPHEIAAIGDERFDRIAEALADEPCPLLDPAGRCRVYDDRPLICRLMGLGMRTPAGRVIENACPIAADFPAYAALAPAPFDLEAFEEKELGLLAGAGEELFGSEAYHDFETFVAAAVAR
jgi:Fe-S-cluster containining protein